MVASSSTSTSGMMIPRTRSTPFTPKRPLSRTISVDEIPPVPGSVARFPNVVRAHTPVDGQPQKKIKASISSEARTRTTSRPKVVAGLDVPAPSTPKRGDRSRSTTPLPPGSPRTPKRPNSALDVFGGGPMESEMDVSRVDPEEVLVDAENVDVDLSVELDDAFLKTLDHGKEDKVLVSIRYVVFESELYLIFIYPLKEFVLLVNKKHGRLTRLNDVLSWVNNTLRLPLHLKNSTSTKF